MGETAELRNALAGTFGFNDFISQGDSEATIRRLLRIMLPVIDMRDFQRRYRFDQGTQNLIIGELLQSIVWTVPDNEYWKPLALFFFNGDTAPHDIVSRMLIPGTQLVPLQLARTRIDANNIKRVFGTTDDGSMSTSVNTFWMSDVPIILQPGHSFSLEDTDVAVAGSAMRWVFLYELVPAPATDLAQGVVAAVTVV